MEQTKEIKAKERYTGTVLKTTLQGKRKVDSCRTLTERIIAHLTFRTHWS